MKQYLITNKTNVYQNHTDCHTAICTSLHTKQVIMPTVTVQYNVHNLNTQYINLAYK